MAAGSILMNRHLWFLEDEKEQTYQGRFAVGWVVQAWSLVVLTMSSARTEKVGTWVKLSGAGGELFSAVVGCARSTKGSITNGLCRSLVGCDC